MIGIYVLLLLAMLAVIKFSKGKLKVILAGLIILITLYCVILDIDRNRVFSNRLPIFAKSSELKDYELKSTEVYKGLGYRIEVDKISEGKISAITMYLGNKVIAGVINDYVEAGNVEIQYEENSILISDKDIINNLYNIVTSYTYNQEPCKGIFTHTIKINNEAYYLLEDCKEINYKGKQSKINEDDLKYIVEITKKYSNNKSYIVRTIDSSYKTYYEMSDGTWMCDDNIYKYRLEISGKLSNASKDITFVYLSNIKEISFEQASKASGLSSNLSDYFDPSDAIFVEYIGE